MDFLMNFDEQLATVVRQRPKEYCEIFETAVRNVYINNYFDPNEDTFTHSSEVPKF